MCQFSGSVNCLLVIQKASVFVGFFCLSQLFLCFLFKSAVFVFFCFNQLFLEWNPIPSVWQQLQSVFNILWQSAREYWQTSRAIWPEDCQHHPAGRPSFFFVNKPNKQKADEFFKETRESSRCKKLSHGYLS
jgi:hypothetical protein